jgi:hypothetical protein
MDEPPVALLENVKRHLHLGKEDGAEGKEGKS